MGPLLGVDLFLDHDGARSLDFFMANEETYRYFRPLKCNSFVLLLTKALSIIRPCAYQTRLRISPSTMLRTHTPLSYHFPWKESLGSILGEQSSCLKLENVTTSFEDDLGRLSVPPLDFKGLLGAIRGLPRLDGSIVCTGTFGN